VFGATPTSDSWKSWKRRGPFRNKSRRIRIVQQLRRNVVHSICAAVMVIAMSCEGVNALYWEFARDVDDPTRMLLGVETVCLVAFRRRVDRQGRGDSGLRDAPDPGAQADVVAGVPTRYAAAADAVMTATYPDRWTHVRQHYV
jgi:hypothetical protein